MPAMFSKALPRQYYAADFTRELDELIGKAQRNGVATRSISAVMRQKADVMALAPISTLHAWKRIRSTLRPIIAPPHSLRSEPKRLKKLNWRRRHFGRKTIRIALLRPAIQPRLRKPSSTTAGTL
jgi:hypothetical protein